MKNREIYINKMKVQLDELNAKMDTLEAKASNAKDAAHEKYAAEMAKLHQQSKVTKAKFDDLVDAGEDKWDDMVVEMEKVRDAFVHSFHYFKSQLKD